MGFFISMLKIILPTKIYKHLYIVENRKQKTEIVWKR